LRQSKRSPRQQQQRHSRRDFDNTRKRPDNCRYPQCERCDHRNDPAPDDASAPSLNIRNDGRIVGHAGTAAAFVHGAIRSPCAGKCFEAFYASTDTKSDFGAEQSGQVQSSGT
jgi:hypothetical protein